jgi:hypothetical protein
VQRLRGACDAADPRCRAACGTASPGARLCRPDPGHTRCRSRTWTPSPSPTAASVWPRHNERELGATRAFQSRCIDRAPPCRVRPRPAGSPLVRRDLPFRRELSAPHRRRRSATRWWDAAESNTLRRPDLGHDRRPCSLCARCHARLERLRAVRSLGSLQRVSSARDPLWTTTNDSCRRPRRREVRSFRLSSHRVSCRANSLPRSGRRWLWTHSAPQRVRESPARPKCRRSPTKLRNRIGALVRRRSASYREELAAASVR